ncbi:MAG: cysteine synthase A [Chloroflexi bacterium]|nr:cysteine synthase A [Chloroflexota bacterium]
MKADNILEVIGNTPEVRLHRLFGERVQVWLKLERQNPGGSIKDRIAVSMIEDAEARGVLHPGSVVIEPTSGNTGVGLALACAVKGYRLVLVMPESMSVERRRLMAAYGATFELTPRELGMRGSVERAEELVRETENAWMPMQFANPANVEVHRRTTAQEILRDFPDGLDEIVAGVGTGGHLSACGEVLKPLWPHLRTVAVEPEASPVISEGRAGPHPIQGLGANFVPENFHRDAVDEVVTVGAADAFEFARRCAREEGILCGISTGAVLAAVGKRVESLPDNARVLTFAYDTGERYLSVEGLFA